MAVALRRRARGEGTTRPSATSVSPLAVVAAEPGTWRANCACGAARTTASEDTLDRWLLAHRCC